MRRPMLILAAAALATGAAALSIYGMGAGEVHAPASSPPVAAEAPPVAGGPTFLPPDKRVAAPTITMTGRDGTSFGLERFADKIVVLNFWATWCAPCIEELPSLVRLQEKLGTRAFVVALSLDRGGLDEVVPFLEEQAIAFEPYVDASMAAMRLFRLSGLPTTVIIDGQGREIGRIVGPAVWDDAMHLELIEGFVAETQSDAGATSGSPQP